MGKNTTANSINPAELRKKSGENQTTFWRRYGITQSGGSRYEQGRQLPAPARILVALHTSGKVSEEDLALARAAAGL